MHRRLFLEVREPTRFVEELASGLFVSTRLALSLGDELTLALHLPERPGPLEVPVVVVGRRLPRGASMLSAGVVVRAVSMAHPSVQQLAAGTAPRRAARAIFATWDDAGVQLAEVLGEEGAAWQLGDEFRRGDRLAVEVVVGARVVGRVHLRVRRLHRDPDGVRTIVVPDDDAAGGVAAVLASVLRRDKQSSAEGQPSA